jgi:hypothetical protein
LHKNGNLVADDGVTTQISLDAPENSYYIVIRHRNHLAVMSAEVVALNPSTSTLYDFTTGSGNFFGGSSGVVEMETSTWGMISGDGNGNGQIQNNDSEDIWKPDNGTGGYKTADYNLNGQVQNNDNEDYWEPNNGKGTQVPN